MQRLWFLMLAATMVRGQDFGERERALGSRLADDFRNRHVMVENRAIVDYVQRVGAKMTEGYTFQVFVDDSAGLREPVSLPGGHIFVSTGLLIASQNENEFAGMIAHAIGHVVNGDLKIRPPQAGTIPLVFIAGGNTVPAGVRAQRESEITADRWAITAMAPAGWDPAALRRYFERMQPADDSRLASMDAAIGVPAPPNTLESGDFAFIQEQVRQLTPPRKIPSLRDPG